jgi:hypothetical protein
MEMNVLEHTSHGRGNEMTDAKCMQATPAATLEEHIMDSRHAKTEAEWWASREIISLRQQLAEANETLKDHGEIQADLCRQLDELEDDEQKAVERCVIAEQRLAESQAREKVRIEALEVAEYALSNKNSDQAFALNVCVETLAQPQDSTALDEAIKASIEDERQNPWKMALMDGLVITHTLCKEHETDPRKAVNDLISWHVTDALDPQLSSAADELVRQAKREALMDASNEINEQDDMPVYLQLRCMVEEMK